MKKNCFRSARSSGDSILRAKRKGKGKKPIPLTKERQMPLTVSKRKEHRSQKRKSEADANKKIVKKLKCLETKVADLKKPLNSKDNDIYEELKQLQAKQKSLQQKLLEMGREISRVKEINDRNQIYESHICSLLFR